jgi:hypothetical protein
MARGPRTADENGDPYVVRVKAGLFTGEHCEAMGSAVWLFGALLNAQTDDDGSVLHGREITYQELSEWTGFSQRTLRQWMRILRVKYVDSKRTDRGMVLKIVNPQPIRRAARSRQSKSGRVTQSGRAEWQNAAVQSDATAESCLSDSSSVTPDPTKAYSEKDRNRTYNAYPAVDPAINPAVAPSARLSDANLSPEIKALVQDLQTRGYEFHITDMGAGLRLDHYGNGMKMTESEKDTIKRNRDAILDSMTAAESVREDKGGVSPGGRAEGLRPADKREAASASGIAGETGRGNPATPPETTEQDLLEDKEGGLPF